LPTFTVSREDVYDYFRCPKIVAIKSYRLLHTPPRVAHARMEPEVSASVIGRVGEAAVAAAFSHAAVSAGSPTKLRELLARQAVSEISRMGAILDSSTKAIITETIEGLSAVRSFISDEFGEVQVIGRGQCKNGPFPGEALPDFVALSPRQNQPILIEVKNTPKPLKTDHFQAAFYNTVARETGVVVHEERMVGAKLDLTPIAYHNSIADTLLVYPRANHFERVSDTVDVSEDTLKEIWMAKQLGYLGRSPHTDCHTNCPHHRLGVELSEGNIEVAIPLPLVYSKGLTEIGFDLDTNYLSNFFYKSAISTELFDTIFHAWDDPLRKKVIVEKIAVKTQIPIDTVWRMVYPQQRSPDSEKIMRNMAAEVEPWEKILGEKASTKITGPAIQGLATRYFTLPNRSEDFVKRTWKKWKG